MESVISIGGVVNDDVKIVAALALHHDKLLISGGVAADVVHKDHVPSGVKSCGAGASTFTLLSSVGVSSLRVGCGGKAAKAHLLASLFNSVSTLDNHYTMQYNHNYGGSL